MRNCIMFTFRFSIVVAYCCLCGSLFLNTRRFLSRVSSIPLLSSKTNDYNHNSISTDRNATSSYRIWSTEWARERGMEPGYGGIWPGDPNAKRYRVKIIDEKTGEEHTLDVPEDRYIYQYFEEEGIDIPVVNKKKMCRQGCCTICAAKTLEGKSKMDMPLGLLRDLRQQGYILMCCSYPRSDLVISLQGEDEVYVKQWGESFAKDAVEWGGVFLDED